MISLHRINKLVMGAAVDKSYSRCNQFIASFRLIYSSARSPTVTFYFFIRDF